MSCFTKMSTVSAASDLDLTKHVNYTAGMILGVDDFTQEFAYLSGRDRWLARDAIGYGTVSGLSVRIEKDAEKGHRVMVTPGVAISPRGQLICVSATQCAYLNQWLAAAKPEDLLEWIGGTGSPPVVSSPSGADALTLYVVLCYRDCLTDNVPIPGEPCRNSDEVMSDSRVKDDFSLELRFEPPKQPEEEAVRNYCDFLRQITITDDVSPSTSIEDFLDAIRDEFLSSGSPAISSPPVTLQIHPEDVAEYMRLAFRLWVTELRNVLSERETGCAVEMTGGKKLEDCVLLAELRIPLEFVSPGWKVSDDEDAEVEIKEENRPFLLHLRMLQEWMLSEPNDHGALIGLEDDDHPQYLLIDGTREMTGNLQMGGKKITNLAAGTANNHAVNYQQAIKVGDTAGGDLTKTYPNPEIAKLQGKDVVANAPANGHILIYRTNKWVTEKPITDHSELTGLDKDDHKQYLPLTGSRKMTGNLRLGNHQVKEVAPATENGDAVIYEQAVKHTDSAGGDVGGIFNNLQITHLQGNQVDAKEPQTDDVLVWNGTSWVPGPGSGRPPLLLPFATIDYAQGFWEFDIWFNIDAPENQAEIKKLTADDFTAQMEINVAQPGQPATFLLDAGIRNVKRIGRNLFRILLDDHSASAISRLRFDFRLELEVTRERNARSIAKYASESNIRFMGQNEKTITIFVRVPGTIQRDENDEQSNKA